MTDSLGSGTVACPVRAAARAHPDRAAVIAPGRTFSFLQVDATVAHAAAQVRSLRVAPGSAVAIHLPQTERYPLLLLGLIRAGCIVAPLNTRIPPAAVPPLLRAAGATHLITDNQEAAAAADSASVAPLDPGALLSGTSGQAGDLAPIAIAASQPATLVFTSGSTGEPKAALHSLGNHLASAAGSNHNIRLAPGDRWLLSLPLYHVGGIAILFRCLAAGAAVVVPPAGEPPGESIVRFGITHLSLVATQLLRLLRERSETESLRAVLLGGSAIPPGLLAEAHARGLPVHTSYGMTEMASQVTTTAPRASPAELSTSGRILPHRELRISQGGEILVRGDTLFLGYLGPDGTDPARDAEGWFHTGDLGTVGADGLLGVAGRRDNLFISGGENIQPEEIEHVLGEHPQIDEAIVVPVPDREWGQRPVAFIRGVTKPPPAAEIEAWLGERLPRYMVPVAFLPWPTAETSARMKPDRIALAGTARELPDASS